MYRDRRRYYGKKRNNKQYRPQYRQYEPNVPKEELKKFKCSTIVVVFLKVFIAIAIGIIIGIAFGFGIYRSFSLADLLILIVGTTTGVLSIVFIFRYRKKE